MTNLKHTRLFIDDLTLSVEILSDLLKTIID